MMTAHEIQRSLRLITSKEFRRKQWFPVTVLAQLCGLSRETIYQARAGNSITARVIETLSPLLRDILAGKMTAKREAWQVTVKEAEMEARRSDWEKLGRYF